MSLHFRSKIYEAKPLNLRKKGKAQKTSGLFSGMDITRVTVTMQCCCSTMTIHLIQVCLVGEVVSRFRFIFNSATTKLPTSLRSWKMVREQSLVLYSVWSTTLYREIYLRLVL